jgi:hypothetical protein
MALPRSDPDVAERQESSTRDNPFNEERKNEGTQAGSNVNPLAPPINVEPGS